MDIKAYADGKESGVSKITLHPPTTLLVTYPDEKGSPVDRGYQPADIAAMIASNIEKMPDECAVLQDDINSVI